MKSSSSRFMKPHGLLEGGLGWGSGSMNSSHYSALSLLTCRSPLQITCTLYQNIPHVSALRGCHAFFLQKKHLLDKVFHEIKPWWTSPCWLQSFLIFNKLSFITCSVYCWRVHKEWDHRQTGGLGHYYGSFI